ncbi:SRPBCC family protein [uncultured Corynebacterium sp.]|uniref:SRPBCC family protein n=1 Tax=uncultured Corynebacterium sp. TaxID=159447 RepID=UPI0025D4CBDA|nr:SRPBCC family protein [uncultured Corynebacterium sp.]
MTATTPVGEIVRSDDATILRFRRGLAHPIDAVWRALTDPDATAAWIGPWSGDPDTGTVELAMTAEADGPPHSVEIIECTKPDILMVRTSGPGDGWRLEVRLEEAGSATVLHFGQPLADPGSAADIGPGWHYYLDRLEAALDGRPIDMDWDADYYPALKDDYLPN